MYVQFEGFRIPIEFIFLKDAMGKYIFILVFGFFSFSSLALEESELSVVYSLLNAKEFYQTGTFKGEKDIYLRYAKFAKERGEKGSVVFINGLAENLFKYLELFYDLYLQGYSPIYTYDHRGQGLSNRFLSNPLAGYVEDFSHYSRDLGTFIHDVVLRDPEVDKNSLFAIAHSMGGTVVVSYLQTDLHQNPFKAVVLSSPLFHPKTEYSEYFDWIETLALNAGKYYYCGIDSWRFDSCLDLHSIDSSQESLTDSHERFGFFLRTRRFAESIFGMLDPWVEPTYHWVVEMLKATEQLMQKEEIEKVTTPLLILQSEKDRLVSNEHQDQFCEVIPDFCRIRKLPGQHEHFIEVDKVRNQALQEILNFFVEVDSQ